MRNFAVIIEEQKIDLYPNTNIAPTFQICNIGDLRSRNVTYTNQIKVPKTSNNRIIFGFPEDEHSQTTTPYVKLRGKVLSNGMEIIPNALIIVSTVDNIYNLQIYDGTLSFFESIEGKKLGDLRTEPYDYWSFNVNSVLTQPLIDYGTFYEYANAHVRPGREYYTVPYSFLIEQIITQAGYEKEGAIFSDPKYLAMAVPALGYGNLNERFGLPKEFDAYVDTAVTHNASNVTSLVQFPIVVQNGGFYNGTDLYEVDNPYYAGTYFTYNGFAQITIANVVYSGGATRMRFRLWASGNRYQRALVVGASTLTFEISDAIVADPDGSPVTRAVGIDGAAMFMEVITTDNVGTPTGSAVITFGTSRMWNKVELTKSKYSQLDQLYKSVQSILPDETQEEIMQDFAFRFGLVFKEKNGVLMCKSFSEIINDRQNAVNWTTKRLKGDDGLAFEFGNYCQTNTIDYNDSDELSEELGKGVLLVNNVNIPLEKGLYTSPFTKSETTKRGNDVAGYITLVKIPAVETEYRDIVQPKTECVAKTYENVALTGLTIRQETGYPPNPYVNRVLTAGDRVLVNMNTNKAENGIWVAAAGAWARAADMNSAAEFTAALVPLREGKYKYDGTGEYTEVIEYWLQVNDTITVGTDDVVFLPSSQNGKRQLKESRDGTDPGLRLILIRDNYSYEPALADTSTSYQVGYFEDGFAPYSLSMQSFIDEYYGSFADALQKAKVITRDYDLNDVDIASLDLFKLIYDNGSYYILVKTKEYLSGTPTEVELFKVS